MLRGADARARPMHAFGRIAEYYAEAVGADRGYGGVLTHNPMARAQPRGLRTTWGRREPYRLAELAAPIPRGWRRPGLPASAVGRNCAIFGALMRFAGYAENQLADLAAAAGALNRQLEDPLDAAELAGIVRSIERYRAGWIARGAYYTEAEREGWGRTRGIRSGQVRRERTAERDAAILADRAAGLSQRAIAEKHGVYPRDGTRTCCAAPRSSSPCSASPSRANRGGLTNYTVDPAFRRVQGSLRWLVSAARENGRYS